MTADPSPTLQVQQGEELEFQNNLCAGLKTSSSPIKIGSEPASVFKPAVHILEDAAGSDSLLANLKGRLLSGHHLGGPLSGDLEFVRAEDAYTQGFLQ